VSGKSIQTPTVNHTILGILLGGTILLLCIGFFISLRFKLNGTTHAILVEEVQKMRTSNRVTPEAISAEHRAVVEELTGMPYEQLWGNNTIGFVNRQRAKAHAVSEQEHVIQQ
jgi:oligogalacturonide transporter